MRKVLKELGLSDSLQAAGDERIRQAYVYIDEHIGSDMTVASIAGHFCMSESRFPICSARKRACLLPIIWFSVSCILPTSG